VVDSVDLLAHLSRGMCSKDVIQVLS